MTTYGRSPWIEQLPKTSRPGVSASTAARQRRDVVIIGGGLTGCATAYAFAAAGAKVTLLDAATIGRGSSGASSGWLYDDPGVGFADLERAIGRRAARSGRFRAGAVPRSISPRCCAVST